MRDSQHSLDHMPNMKCQSQHQHQANILVVKLLLQEVRWIVRALGAMCDTYTGMSYILMLP